MPPSSESANPTLPGSPDAEGSRPKSHSFEDLPYMTMTVAAILLLLCSLWVF